MILLQAADPDAARAEVRDILGDRRFRSDPAPRPFRGPLEWLGDRISTIGGWISDVASAVPWFVWLAIALAVFALLARWIVKSVGRRRARATGAVARDMRATNEDPAVLEREADDAERRGDLERAVRLRFRAGLLRLGDRGAIAYRPSLTTTEVRGLLGSASFDQLAATFDEVTYGDEPADADDVAAARAGWPRVVRDSPPQRPSRHRTR